MCKPKVFRFTHHSLLFTSLRLFSSQCGRKVLAVRVYGLRSEHLNAHQLKPKIIITIIRQSRLIWGWFPVTHNGRVYGHQPQSLCFRCNLMEWRLVSTKWNFRMWNVLTTTTTIHPRNKNICLCCMRWQPQTVSDAVATNAQAHTHKTWKRYAIRLSLGIVTQLPYLDLHQPLRIQLWSMSNT